MSVFDLIVLAVVLVLTLRGVMKGMVSQIVSISSYIICWIIASRFAFLIAPSIPAEEPWNRIGAMIVLFVVTMIAIRFAHALFELWIKHWHLQKLNRFLGGTLGLVKGLFLCMVLTFFGVMVSETTRQIVFESKSGLHLADLIEKTGSFIPKDSCELLREQIDLFQGKFARKVDDTESEFPEQDFFTSLRQSVDKTTGSDTASTGISDLVTRSKDLLEETQSLQNTLKEKSNQAVSLLDGIKRWWNGSSKDESSDEPAPEEHSASTPISRETKQSPATAASPLLFRSAAADPVTENQAQNTTAAAPAPPEIPEALAATGSPLYREEAIFRKRNSTTSISAERREEAASALAQLLPLAAPETEAGSTSLGNRLMSISRSGKRNFSHVNATLPPLPPPHDLLDNSRTVETETPARLFAPR